MKKKKDLINIWLWRLGLFWYQTIVIDNNFCYLATTDLICAVNKYIQNTFPQNQPNIQVINFISYLPGFSNWNLSLEL